MARASRLHREGQGFESLVAHQIVFAGIGSWDIIITIIAGAKMDRICDLLSFIVTGASASGKTTLVEHRLLLAGISIYLRIQQGRLDHARCRVITVFFSVKGSLRTIFAKGCI